MRHDLSTEHTSGRHTSGPNELTTKGRIQIQTHTQTIIEQAENYDPEGQARRDRQRSHGRRLEDGDEISLESFENAKSRTSQDTQGTQNQVLEARFNEEALGGSQAKLVPVVPFEQVKW
jgi:hypothetical protein